MSLAYGAAMNRKFLQSQVDKIFIANPCVAKWEDMDGGQTVRFCGQCSKNVHNLSAMAPEELAFTLEKRKREPTCVYMSKRANGSVVIDNCPEVFRATRDRIQAYAAMALFLLLWSLATGADAQGLVGAPVDVRYGNPVSNPFTDFGYDQARDMTHIITGSATAIAFVLALFVPFNKKKKATVGRVALELLALTMIPVLTHLAGTFILNNYGGIGGGGL